ncbi:MAG TPA: DUF4058 family protein, partial [Planctomycetaceae bacterium]
MPVHDWTRVVAGNFHDFHQRWIVAISDALNGGLLPPDHYAMVEQKAEGPEPDVLTLQRGEPSTGGEPWSGGVGFAVETLLSVAERPPQVEVVEEGDDAEAYARLADRVAVYHASGDRVVAFVEIVSPGNKGAEAKVREFVTKLSGLFDRGCHLLLIDLMPPGTFDPRGMHAAFWEYREGRSHGVAPDRPLAVSAYRAGPAPTAYFQPLKVGDRLPNMPLFLTPKHYVNVPLEDTYIAA